MYCGAITSIAELRSLPFAERIQLMGDLWDSIADESACLQLTDAQRAELDRRLDDFEGSPGEGVPWVQVRGTMQRKPCSSP